MNSSAEPIAALRSSISFNTLACTLTSSAVVGSSQISTSGPLAMAIATTTRWR